MHSCKIKKHLSFLFISEWKNAQLSDLKQLSKAKALTKTNKKTPYTANFPSFTPPLLIFDHTGRENQVVETLIKEIEQEKYSLWGQILTFQERCQRQTTAASLFVPVCALQKSTILDFNSISKQNIYNFSNLKDTHFP